MVQAVVIAVAGAAATIVPHGLNSLENGMRSRAQMPPESLELRVCHCQ